MLKHYKGATGKSVVHRWCVRDDDHSTANDYGV